MNILGIDTGKKGGLCFIHKSGVQVGTIPELLAFADYVKQCKEYGPLLVFIEAVNPRPSDAENVGKSMQIAKLFAHYNSLQTILMMLDAPYIMTYPISWQNYLKKAGVNPKKFKNKKNAYKAFAIEKFPQKLKQINLKTADAICIAWYGNQVLNRFPSKTLERVKNKSTLKLFK